jgi:hypothetical protein
MFRTLAFLCLLAAPAPAETLRLTGGTPTPVPGTELRVTLTEVQDQRCPPDVDCYWEGMIRISLMVYYDLHRAPAAFPIFLCNLCDGATRQMTTEGFTFALEGLEPSTADLAALGRPVELADYTVLVTVGPAP